MKAENIINKLTTLYHEKKLSHAYLIETNNLSKCVNDVKIIIKRINCKNEYSDSCGLCNLCHLVDQNNLPSFIIIEPDGKSIKKDAIENLKDSFSKKPIYTDNNIYIIKSPEKMNGTAYNKLLKFLEEPEDNIIGFFITENKDDVANTIISRCEIIKIMYDDNTNYDLLGINENQYNHLKDLAIEYRNQIENSSSDLVWYNSSVLLKEFENRNDTINFLKILLSFYMKDLSDNYNQHLHQKVKIISKYLEEINFNVNISLLLNSLAIELGELYGK
ncbi:MAG: hypothetical protein E7164_02310 [Firmicutes bacterium]|nr:hypothetical protein [Bacillota bacterium]